MSPDKHLGADLLEFVVDALERVGRVLGVGVEQLEQHLLAVLDQTGCTARAHAQQAEHRHVLLVDREQDALAADLVVGQVQDEGHPRGARFVAAGDQEVAADVEVAVLLGVEAGRLLDVLVHGIGRDHDSRNTARPTAFPAGWGSRDRPIPA